MVYDVKLILILLPKCILPNLKLTPYHKYHMGINADYLKTMLPNLKSS